MRYPEFLKSGDTIGFVAPSFGCTTEPYKTGFMKALTRFLKLAYQTKTGRNCYVSDGFGISSTPENCGSELNEAYIDPESKALISCGGGELMCEVVSYMDFGSVQKASPKWFMGYSDNTNFTFLSAILADTASIYGPCASSFSMEPLDPSLQDALDLLAGKKLTFRSYPKWELESLRDEDHPLVPYNLTEETHVRAYTPVPENALDPEKKRYGRSGGFLQETEDPVTVSGRLIGGCMDCLVNLSGTKYDKVSEFADKYKEDGLIWFLESCELNNMSIRRSLWNFKEAGWFQHVNAFLIGRPATFFGESLMGLDQYRAVLDILADFGVPVIMDCDFGHLPPSIPLICGACANVTFAEHGITVEHILK